MSETIKIILDTLEALYVLLIAAGTIVAAFFILVVLVGTISKIIEAL